MEEWGWEELEREAQRQEDERVWEVMTNTCIGQRDEKIFLETEELRPVIDRI